MALRTIVGACLLALAWGYGWPNPAIGAVAGAAKQPEQDRPDDRPREHVEAVERSPHGYAIEFRGTVEGKWGTPDVIGVYKSLASNLIKFPLEIVSAEIKSDPQAPVTAFGQAVAYRLFSAKCYVVMPTTISDEDQSRLEALCMLFGVETLFS